MVASTRLSEQRARVVTRELLSFRGWDLRPVSSGGQLLEESEYLAYPVLAEVFKNKSKTGPGIGKPDFLLVESSASLRPLIVIDTKPRAADLGRSIRDTQHYGNAIYDAGNEALCVAVAGADREICEVRVQRRINNHWRPLTLHGEPINWIPSPAQTSRILSIKGSTEVAPERPPDQVLAAQAMRLNEILRECKIKDEFRPIYAATFMLALWQGEVSTDASVVLDQVNSNAARALTKAKKSELSGSLRVDAENETLAERAWEIVDILEKLGIHSFLQEHDYLGQLYETFFRYTGGNTIGQYFTPRHIIQMLCELVEVSPSDVVFDPTCGTGGFLIGALRRMVNQQKLSYEDAVKKLRDNIYGMESEPATAALCITNMILRGDGKSGVIRADCFRDLDYPPRPADVALMNPPFPHSKRDVPPEKFIDRALAGTRNKGLLAAVVPYSLLVRTTDWHRRTLQRNRLLFVATMPPDLFSPYASFNTAVIVLQKGIPHAESDVLFARLWNDGYKLKKNTRVPQDGSQVDEIIEAFRDKREKPELTAVCPIREQDSEWSPEAYIRGNAHSDATFIAGFERHIRAQAAFYISSAYRLLHPGSTGGMDAAPKIFATSSELSLSGLEMGPFNISEHFDIELGGKDEIEDLGDNGSTPIVSTSEFNNGVTAWKQANTVFAPPVITVATDGSTCSSFVQEFPFYAFYKVAILKPKHRIPTDALYYVAYLLSLERWRYVYARKFGKARISRTVLYGPAKNGAPDFETMAALSRKCAGFPIISSFRTSYEHSVKLWFQELSAQWTVSGSRVSPVREAVVSPAYRKIVSFGSAVVPHIMEDLRARPDHWLPALSEITGENPFTEGSRDRINEMAEARTKRGRRR